MEIDDTIAEERVDLRPLIGLTRGLSVADIETIAIEAIRTHRRLVNRAQELYEALPESYQQGEASGGAQHLEYVKATIDMHAQMSILTTLVQILGYTPTVRDN